MMVVLAKAGAKEAAAAPGEEWPQLEREEERAAAADGSGARVELQRAEPEPAPAIDGFWPSAQFDGAREGQVFKLGAHGVGYYRDAPPQKPASTALVEPLAATG